VVLKIDNRYDYAAEAPTMWFSVGRIDGAGDYGDGSAWKACYRPYLHYPLAALFAGN
jgi:hypothetical protein